jgi:alpha-beta hydrolase superfamily lysophospholipase
VTASKGVGVDSVIADVESAGQSERVVCGHSLGGVTVPGVVAKLGTSRVREMVLAAAFLPPQGTSVLPRICGESIHLATEKIDRRQLPDDVRRGYSPAGIVRCLDGSSAGASRACPV